MIGWICVLNDEYRAALAILDEKYDSTGLVRGAGDRNYYVLGRIGLHNVIINLPPAGWHGQVHASKIALDMRSTFPRMRFMLLVGIAGGVPFPQDVRLGDVVLGTQIFPYASGKNTDFGFQHTGMIRAPPRELLEAITFLTQRFWPPEELLLSESIENIRARSGRGATAFVRPAQDRLYKDNFIHEKSGCDCLRPQSQERSRLCPRGDREGDLVRLFQGCIGSENIVMKNAQDRDDIAKKMNILCYEMEAASVMDSAPCLTIRGISDYADGHKNDDWHLYAALAAATCARELLLSLSPFVVSQFPLSVAGNFVDRYMKGAVSNPNVFSGSEIEKLRQTRDSLMERYDFLNETIVPELQNMRNVSPDDLRSVQDKARTLKNSQGELKVHLDTLNHILENHSNLSSSPDPAVQEEYRKLKTQLQRDREAIERLAEIAEGTLDAISKMLAEVSKILGHQPAGIAAIVLRYLRDVMKLWRSSKLSPAAMWQWMHRKFRTMNRPRNSSGGVEMGHIQPEEERPFLLY